MIPATPATPGGWTCGQCNSLVPYGAAHACSNQPRVVNSSDCALVVLVDHNGVADAQARGITYKQAAEWLRHIATMWDAKAAAETN